MYQRTKAHLINCRHQMSLLARALPSFYNFQIIQKKILNVIYVKEVNDVHIDLFCLDLNKTHVVGINN